jgi:two-component system response regulator AtoC
VPPLRERREDIPLLARYFLDRMRGSAASGELSDEAAEILSAYEWPGNIRELRNVVERAVILSGKGLPDAACFRSMLGSAGGLRAASPGPPPTLNIRQRVADLERELVVEAMARAAEKKDAAAMLGIDPRNLAYYLKKHGIANRDAEGQP